jgi:hypothetical protein
MWTETRARGRSGRDVGLTETIASRPEETRGRRLSWLALAPGKRRPARGDERVRTLAVQDTCSGVSALVARCYGNRGAC